MGNLISLESNTTNALDMTGGDINVKQKLNVTGEAVFNKNITLNPNVLINNIDFNKVNKDVTDLKASGGLVGNFGTTDVTAGNITASKVVKTSSINVDGDVTTKYITGNATDGLKLSNGGTSNVTFDSTGVINFNNNNKVNFGPVQINGAGIVQGTADKAFISGASNDTNNLYYVAPRNDANTDFDYSKQLQLNKSGDLTVNGGLTSNSLKVGTSSLDTTGTLNANQVKINGTKSGFSTSGDLTANKATLSSLSVGSNINTGKLGMFSTVINVSSRGTLDAVKIGTIAKGSTITNITFSGKVSDVFNFFGTVMSAIQLKVLVGGWTVGGQQPLTFDIPVGTFSISKDINLPITGSAYLDISDISIQSTTATKFIFSPLNMVINYIPPTNPSMVFNGDVSGDIGIFNNLRTNVMNTNSNIISSSGGTFASVGKSGLVIQGSNNWVLGEVQGSISKSNRLCLSLNDKPMVCINPDTKNLMDGSKDW